MADERIRRQIALIAARLMYDREESEYFTAKRKAARQLGVEYRFRPKDLPSNAEIREHVQALAQCYEGDGRTDRLRAMRLAALRMLRRLSAFRPRLIGSVLTGHVRAGSDVDVHVFSNTLSAVTAVLDEHRIVYETERKRILKHNEERVFTHVHAQDGPFDFELTVYDADKVNYPFKSSITGKLIDRASAAELEELLLQTYTGIDVEGELASLDVGDNNASDDEGNDEDDNNGRFATYRALLLPLESVKQNPTYHPEGDALYHSLQVFDLARDRAPWDDEFLLAALLHDVGKAIDPHDHVQAGLDALGDTVTERTQCLIAHHMDAQAYTAGALGHRARERLRASEHFEDLMLLEELDRAGRRRGAVVGTVDEALAYVRSLGTAFGE
jgi:hypothetical protein